MHLNILQLFLDYVLSAVTTKCSFVLIICISISLQDGDHLFKIDNCSTLTSLLYLNLKEKYLFYQHFNLFIAERMSSLKELLLCVVCKATRRVKFTGRVKYTILWMNSTIIMLRYCKFKLQICGRRNRSKLRQFLVNIYEID